MNLLFINWGDNPGNHIQCTFALLNAFKYADCFDDYYVMTDQPHFYQFFNGRIKIIPLTQEQLTEWKGVENYIFYIKIKGIAYFNQLYPGKSVLFADADTFFYQNPKKMKTLLQENKAFMHMNEGSFESYMQRSNTARRVFPKLESLDLGKYKITKDTCMFNSGVIGLPSDDRLQERLNEILLLCRYLHSQNLKVHYMEQLAFSLVLSDVYGDVNSANMFIAHYWGNKEAWEASISVFLTVCLMRNLTLEEIVSELSGFNFDLPIICRKRTMNKKLKKLAQSLFPDKLVYR